MLTKPDWISVTTYAELYSVTPKTVHKWMAAGLLDTFRVGRLIRVWNAPPADKRAPCGVGSAW